MVRLIQYQAPKNVAECALKDIHNVYWEEEKLSKWEYIMNLPCYINVGVTEQQ